MEIIKIFSNVEDPEENLYSVLLSKEELFLFSESKEDEKPSKKRIAGMAVTSAAGGTIIGKLSTRSLNKMMDKNLEKEKLRAKKRSERYSKELEKKLTSGKYTDSQIKEYLDSHLSKIKERGEIGQKAIGKMYKKNAIKTLKHPGTWAGIAATIGAVQGVDRAIKKYEDSKKKKD